MTSFPLEMFTEIFSHLHGQTDKATLKNVSQASRPLAVVSRQYLFSHIVFRGQHHTIEFFALASEPSITIPPHFQCDSVTFKGTETIDEDNLPYICSKLANIEVKRTLGIHVNTGHGGLPPAATSISAVWGNTLRQLSICGGTHTPSTSFQFLASLPQLEALALQNVKVEETEPAGVQYAFPPGLTHLSLCHCATIWTFFQSHVIPGGGLENVRDLYVKELFFGGEAGVADMRECFRRLHAVNTMTLDPVYQDDRHPNFNCGPYDILRRCWEATILQMQGLKLLRVNCGDLPPKFAAEYVGMYAIQFSRLLVETVVEIYAPQSLDLSNPGACEVLLDAKLDPYSSVSVGLDRSNLIIRGLPGRLPGGVTPCRRVMVCEYPVTFLETDWEQAMDSRLDGL